MNAYRLKMAILINGNKAMETTKDEILLHIIIIKFIHFAI